MADSDPFPEDFFSTRGVDLPSHLSTKIGRWKSLLIVAIMSVVASGPIISFPTLEPIFISEGLFAGPNQVSELTTMYSVALGATMFAQLLGGIAYDAMGPRMLAAGSAFATVASLVGMAVGIQFRSLNFLMWICYPATVIFGTMNSMGAYAWLYLLPESQGTVAALVGAIQCLSDSLVLIAVLFHDQFGLSLPFFFALCSLLAIMSGLVCLVIIPDRTVYRGVAFVATNPDVDLEGNSYGAADSSVKRDAETFLDVVSRALAALRDCCVCFLFHCPGSFLTFIVCCMCSMYMFTISQLENMYPLYLALLGPVTATTLVNVFGGIYAVSGAIALLCLGRVVDHVGFKESVALMNIPIILNFALLCVPSFTPQVLAQVVLSFLMNSFYVFYPRWCLSYAPPELYGSAYGICCLFMGAFQMIGTPFGMLASGFIDQLLTHDYPPAMPYLTTAGMWCFFAVIFCLVYLLLLRYYPMPAPGATTMADIVNYTKFAKEHAEAEDITRKTFYNHDVPAASKRSVQASSTPACVPCDCIRSQLGSRASR